MKGSVFSKISAFILVWVLLFSFVSCDNDISEETTAEEVTEAPVELPGGSISVPYSSSDSLNPYFSDSVLNNALTSLVYRSLYRLDTSFSPVKDLAVSESISGLFLRVTIIQELVFSDSTQLTAEDVVYSFECAKSSEVYSSGLSGIASCKAEDKYTVVFELKSEDVNILNALTFPVVKKNTAAADSSLPIGNGYYQYNQDGIRLSLKANLQYAGGLPQKGTVRLTDVSSNISPQNLVPSGEIDFYYSDLSDAAANDINTSSTGVYLNNLVYMGVNHSNVNLVLASFRQALSYGIDRQSLAENAFRGFARAAVVPFNTSWTGYTSSLSAAGAVTTANGEKTQELLSQRGFGKDGIPLDVTLICNEGNAFIRNTANEIAASLKPYNVNIDVQFLSSEELKKNVEAGTFDLYIAEIKLPSTMDLSQFFTLGGSAAYGMIFDNLTADEAYFRYKKGEITIDDFISLFNADMPFIPLVYRNGRFLYTRSIISELSASENALYADIYKWKFAE